MVWGVFAERVRAAKTGSFSDEALVAKSLQASRTALAALAALAGDARFLAGVELSLADLHAYPIIRYLSLVPEGKALIDEQPTLSDWLSRLGVRASVQRTATEYE
jgi:glutathione S-transferase